MATAAKTNTQKNHKNHKKSRKIYYNKVKNLVLIFSQGKVAACHLLEESFARIVDSWMAAGNFEKMKLLSTMPGMCVREWVTGCTYVCVCLCRTVCACVWVVVCVSWATTSDALKDPKQPRTPKCSSLALICLRFAHKVRPQEPPNFSLHLPAIPFAFSSINLIGKCDKCCQKKDEQNLPYLRLDFAF